METPPNAEARRPRSTYGSRVDEKGRLKLPAEVARYLKTLGAADIYVTSFDGHSARIYINTEWDKQEALLESPGSIPTGAKRFSAGQERTAVRQRSITRSGFSCRPGFRRAMGVENQPVMVTCMKGHVEVLSEPEFEKKLAPEADSDAMLRHFSSLGLR